MSGDGTLRGGATALPVGLRPVRLALEELDLGALDRAGRIELDAMLAAAQAAFCWPPAGWRRADESPCLRVVAGLPCEGLPGVQPCSCCAAWVLAGFLDHRRLWDTPRGLVLTAELYEVVLTDPKFGAFLDHCRRLGLEVRASGESSHAPGSTVLLTIRRVAPEDL